VAAGGHEPGHISDWWHASLSGDARWLYRDPPQGNANCAWLQHMLHHLKPGGRAGIGLVTSIARTHALFAAQAGKAINISLTLRNWLMGHHIAEYELRGADRADYGQRLLERLAQQFGETRLHLDAPIVDDLSALASHIRAELEARASLRRQKKRLKDPADMDAVILSVCQGRYLRLNVLAELLNRHPAYLRRSHLDELVKTQRIRRAFPATPTHEMQSWRTEELGEIEPPTGN
jgi:hypothetical protein